MVARKPVAAPTGSPYPQAAGFAGVIPPVSWSGWMAAGPPVGIGDPPGVPVLLPGVPAVLGVPLVAAGFPGPPMPAGEPVPGGFPP